MKASYLVLIIVAAYVAIWCATSYALGHDEKDEKMRSLWYMVSIFWPFVWMAAIVSFFVWIFSKNDKR